MAREVVYRGSVSQWAHDQQQTELVCLKCGGSMEKDALHCCVERPYVEDDLVNHPPHYTQGKVECIDAIESALTVEEFRGFCKGNAMKYTFRERHKGGDEDLRKASFYLKRLSEVIKKAVKT